ncbi:MAG: amidinotransferase [Pseudomonadota bacterium]
MSVEAYTETPGAWEQQHSCPVNSHNEWDPLEEVIVGRLEGATIPPGHVPITARVPRALGWFVKFLAGGMHYPKPLVEAAQQQLDGFIHLLEGEGVAVRRPDKRDFKRRFATPDWRSHGFCSACPRDGFLVIGNEIIETPMSWRCRYFEAFPYRSLFKEYFAAGARWTAAPKPQLLDSLYNPEYQIPQPGEPLRYVINDTEPVFDAADFLRCGRDIFYQISNVTNQSGVAWLVRHLGDRYRFHRLETRCRDPLHIDSTFMLLAPGKLLANPEFIDVDRLPPMFKSWDCIVAPEPDPYADSELMARFFSMCSKWISLNVLMLDEKRVIVDKSQRSLIKVLATHGLEPIPCAFTKYLPFGGAFHCATLDIRRRGELNSYF